MYNDNTIEYSTIYQQKAFRTLWKNSSSTYFLNCAGVDSENFDAYYQVQNRYSAKQVLNCECSISGLTSLLLVSLDT